MTYLAQPARDAHGHEYGFGHAAAALVEAGVGDVHARQLADERLKLEKRLQTALAGLGLVRRVSGVEFTAAGDGIDHGRDEVVVRAAAQEADRVVGRAIARRQLLRQARQIDLAERLWHVERPIQPHLGRNVLEQVRHRRHPNPRQHRLPVRRGIDHIGHYTPSWSQESWVRSQRSGVRGSAD